MTQGPTLRSDSAPLWERPFVARALLAALALELRNNRIESEVDFYDFLLRGDKKGDIRLELGGTVFVAQIGPVVARVARVNQPAIYELKAETRAADLRERQGGRAGSRNQQSGDEFIFLLWDSVASATGYAATGVTGVALRRSSRKRAVAGASAFPRR